MRMHELEFWNGEKKKTVFFHVFGLPVARKKKLKTHRGIAHDGLMRKSKGQFQSSTCSRIISLSCLSRSMEGSSNDPGCSLSQHFCVCVWFLRIFVSRVRRVRVGEKKKKWKGRSIQWQEAIREIGIEPVPKHVQLKPERKLREGRQVWYMRKMRGPFYSFSFISTNVSRNCSFPNQRWCRVSCQDRTEKGSCRKGGKRRSW